MSGTRKMTEAAVDRALELHDGDEERAVKALIDAGLQDRELCDEMNTEVYGPDWFEQAAADAARYLVDQDIRCPRCSARASEACSGGGMHPERIKLYVKVLNSRA